MKVTKWVSYEEPGYIDVDDLPMADFLELEDCIVEDIRKNQYKISGRDHQYNDCCPVIDDKYIYRVSMRKWGGIMERAYNLPNEDGLGYVYYSWGYPNDVKPNLPNE